MHRSSPLIVARLAMLLSLTAILFAGLGTGVAAADDVITVDSVAHLLESQKIPVEPFTGRHFDFMVAQARATGASKVLIPPGVHFIDRTLSINSANNLIIDGQGATLLFTHRNQALRIENSADVVVKDLTIDYDPLPFTQGVIVDVARRESRVDVQIDEGYPLDSELLSYFRSRELHLFAIDPEAKAMKPGTIFMKTQDVDVIGDRLVRVGISAADDMSGLEVGDSVVLKYRYAHSIRIDGSENVHFDNVTLHSATNMGIVEANGKGGNRYQVTITPGPRPEGATKDRLLSTNADGFHSMSMERGPIIENSRFELTGDDNLNIHGYFSIVISQPESDVLIVSPNTEGTLGVGDRIEIYDGETFATIASGEVVALSDVFSAEYVQEARRQWHGKWAPENIISRVFHRIQLDRPVDAALGALVSSMDRAGSGAIIRDSVFRGMGRAINYAGHDALIENNVFERTGTAAIALIAEGYWLTGPFPKNIVIRGNTLLNIGIASASRITQNQEWGAISLFKRPQNLYSSGPGIREIRDIVIEDNYIEGAAMYGIMVGNTSGATIRRNTIVNKSEIPEDVLALPHSMFTYNSGIFVFQSDNVVIEDNVIEHVPAHGIYVARSDDVNIVGNNRVIGHAEDVIHGEAVAVALDQASDVTITELELVDPAGRIAGMTVNKSSGIVVEGTNLELLDGMELDGEDSSRTPIIYDDFSGPSLDPALWESAADLAPNVRIEDGTLHMASPASAVTMLSTLELSGDKYAVSAKVHSVADGSIFLGFITTGANARSGLSSAGHAFADANVGGVFERFLQSYPGTINPSAENELLFERDGDTFRLYVNGVLAAERRVGGFPTEGVKILLQTWTQSRDPNDGITATSAWTEVRYGVHAN